MAAADVRQAIADAANTVTGVHVTPYYTQTTKPGNGSVRRERTEYPNPFGGVVFWQVLVVLPGNIGAAERYMDTTVPQIVAAVGEQLVVDDVSAAQLAVDAGTVSVAVINGHREEE